VCPDHSRPPLWCIGFSSSVHWLSYTEYIMCKLSFIHLVNENSSILSLLLLFSSIFSATVYVNSQLDLLCAGSTHLHLRNVYISLWKRRFIHLYLWIFLVMSTYLLSKGIYPFALINFLNKVYIFPWQRRFIHLL
jgi:hypothetical protein